MQNILLLTERALFFQYKQTRAQTTKETKYQNSDLSKCTGCFPLFICLTLHICLFRVLHIHALRCLSILLFCTQSPLAIVLCSISLHNVSCSVILLTELWPWICHIQKDTWTVSNWMTNYFQTLDSSHDRCLCMDEHIHALIVNPMNNNLNLQT